MILCKCFKQILNTSKKIICNISICKFSNSTIASSSLFNVDEKDFQIRNAVIVKKITRYEYEKYFLMPGCTELELKHYINNKSSDYNNLLLRHNEYTKHLKDIETAFRTRGIKYEVVQSLEHVKELMQWADAIFTAGGDGTFLLAASKITGHYKPLIGINTDPIRSEGFLCLPREQSINFDKSLDKIIKGEFSWFWRNRVRMKRDVELGGAINLSQLQLLRPEHRFWEHVAEGEQIQRSRAPLSKKETVNAMKLVEDSDLEEPILALNEIFIGEKLSARVSFYEVAFDGSAIEKQKSSGLIICPGTGSTSWYFNCNNVTTKTVQQIFNIAKNQNNQLSINLSDEEIMKIKEEYNKQILFEPSFPKMAYSVRDPLSTGVYSISSEPRGFCKRIKVRSRMWDGCMVVDGSLSFQFNDGACVELVILQEDALRCISINS